MRPNNIFFTFAKHHDFETKELRIAFSDIDNARFLRGYFQMKPFCNPLCYRCHRSFGIFPIAAKDAKIVGITHDEHFFQPGSAHHHIAFAFINDFRCADYSPIRMTDGQRMFHPLTIYPMVKFIQDHICQQRRYDSALRCSFCGIFRCSVRHTDRGF